MSLHSVKLSERSPLCRISLLDSLFKDKYDAMVIAIQRDNDWILSPSASTIFYSDDVIWFVSTIEAAKMIKIKEEL